MSSYPDITPSCWQAKYHQPLGLQWKAWAGLNRHALEPGDLLCPPDPAPGSYKE
jgi:hypothetical protein